MSTAYGRDTVHFEFYLWKTTDYYNDPSGSLAAYQTILQALTQQFKGTSHWGKSGLVYHNSDHLTLKLDPVARDNFVADMNKHDPYGIFMNNFGRRMKKTGTTVDTDPSTTHCAILDNCICTKDSDCGDTQRCTSITGYNYRVCQTKNEFPEKTIDLNSFPPLSGILTWFSTTITTLATQAIANCSLTGVIGGLGDTVGDILTG